MPTGDILIDGLTKALLRPSFEAFRNQISMVDISDRLAMRLLKEVSLETLEEVEDLIEGGESTTDPVLITSHGNKESDGQPSADMALG